MLDITRCYLRSATSSQVVIQLAMLGTHLLSEPCLLKGLVFLHDKGLFGHMGSCSHWTGADPPQAPKFYEMSLPELNQMAIYGFNMYLYRQYKVEPVLCRWALGVQISKSTRR